MSVRGRGGSHVGSHRMAIGVPAVTLSGTVRATRPASWLETPLSRETPPRDELAIKLAIAVAIPSADLPVCRCLLLTRAQLPLRARIT